MLEHRKNLNDFVLEALMKSAEKFHLPYHHRGMWSDSAADLSKDELAFLPYRPAAAALADWFYAFTPGIPADFPWLQFKYELTRQDSQVHILRTYSGNDPAILIRAQAEIPSLDISATLAAIDVPLIGTNCQSLFDHLEPALKSTPNQQLNFDIEGSSMGGCHTLWGYMEAAIASVVASNRLNHLTFAVLSERALNNGMQSPMDTYTFHLVEGRIYLKMTPSFPAEDIVKEVLATVNLPEDIDKSESTNWIMNELQLDHPPLYVAIYEKATAITIELTGINLDMTDMLKGTPDLPWEY
jgi:hypothetical protein